MTDEELDRNRLKIVLEFLETKEKLSLPELGITVNSSTKSIYHVFSNDANGKLTFLYSMGDLQLKELAKNLMLKTIKKIFIEGRVFRLRNKFLAENEESIPFNPLDFEQSC